MVPGGARWCNQSGPRSRAAPDGPTRPQVVPDHVAKVVLNGVEQPKVALSGPRWSHVVLGVQGGAQVVQPKLSQIV